MFGKKNTSKEARELEQELREKQKELESLRYIVKEKDSRLEEADRKSLDSLIAYFYNKGRKVG